MSTNPIFAVTNHHDASCGTPPHINDTKGDQRLYYFESTFEDQLIFVFDRATQVGQLYCGDAGWERVFPVIDGVARDVILNPIEQSWLSVCWAAATGA